MFLILKFKLIYGSFISIGLYVFDDSILNVNWLSIPDFEEEYIGNKGLSVIRKPIPTDGVIAYKTPILEKSIINWSHTNNTVFSGKKLGTCIQL